MEPMLVETNNTTKSSLASSLKYHFIPPNNDEVDYIIYSQGNMKTIGITHDAKSTYTVTRCTSNFSKNSKT